MEFRKINQNEITALLSQGCFAEDWATVLVKDGFLPERVRNVRFYGKVLIGTLDGELETSPGCRRPAGIFNAWLHNVTIDDRILISNVGFLSNYNIEENVAIENVASMEVNGATAFGNGTELEVLNEGGGRELLIFDSLSAQVAYLMVLYRHDAAMIDNLKKMIDVYVETQKGITGTVAKGARIPNCTTIRNVRIGENAVISGAVDLEDGSVLSSAADPSVIGDGVIARHFIIQSGSKVDSGALLDKCFVGQGVRIGKQYSAENSAFFANCEGFHGEAVGLFAGPYTVTHHKSTLLIAGLFSFFNAGSGSNQSNHMYKLGPLHQGILERGSKTGSFSYMLWPSRVGAFSVVTGKHYINFDASEFPFSYITEEEGKTVLTPAMNLFTVGTRRDSVKWPKRDRRKDACKYDLIHFDLFSPYIMAKILRGIEVLENLREKASPDQEYVFYKGLQIKRLLLRSGIKFYKTALKIYLGQNLVDRLQQLQSETSLPKLLEKLVDNRTVVGDAWVDLAGMLTPQEDVETLQSTLRTGRISTLQELSSGLLEMYQQYSGKSWAWCRKLIEKEIGIDLEKVRTEQLVSLVQDWAVTRAKFNNMILNDASKEFDNSSKIGFGIDGDDAVRNADFEAIRGTLENNSFANGLKEEIAAARVTADALNAFLQTLS